MQEERGSVPEPPPRESAVRLFAPGTEVGTRYEIRSVLGTGGSASVYAAWDRDLKRLVALKALRHDRMSPSALKRFRREVAVARDAASPRLVRVFDIGEAGETVFLTMELVEGGSLRERLAAGPLEAAEALRIGQEILRALADLHRLGIVHRDVKPGNVLLSQDGAVKLADFGLARHWEGGDTRATETEGIVGTMEYLAPEQALGRTVDARTDIYAFGVLLYEMLAGSVPFVSDSVLGGVVARLREPAPDVRKVRPGTPAWLAAVVAKTLEKEPEGRYATAGELLADLEARRAPGRRRLSLRSARPPLLLAAVVAVAALALLGAFLAVRGLPGATPVSLRLLRDGASGIRAVDGSGRVLWSRSDVIGPETAAVVRLGGRKGLRVAAALQPSTWVPKLGERPPFALLDPASGKEVERRPLASAAVAFREFSDTFRVNRVAAVDVDGDGADEVVVIFTHSPWYPAYVVLFEPGSSASRVLLAHSGHLRLRGAFDLDGDGRRELVFDGPNNRMGWLTGIAALRVPSVPVSASARQDWPLVGAASSPDELRSGTGQENLLWYALGSTALHQYADNGTFDPASRILTLGTGPSAVSLTADGFAPGAGSRLPADERQAARNRAYSLLRDAVQREETGYAAEALGPARAAIDEARAAGDEPLAGWARRVWGRIAIESGHGDEGEKELQALAATSEAAPEIAFELGRGFHLAGEFERSARWYAWALSRARVRQSGRLVYEFLEGEVFALAEAKRWSEAEEAISRVAAAFPAETSPAVYRAFLLWLREGRAVARLDVPYGADLYQYWALEIRFALGEELDPLARDVESRRAVASESGPLLRSLSAEIERRRGNLDAALAQATAAWSEIRSARLRQTWARVHAPLVAERLARIAEKAGRPDVARETRAALRSRPAPVVGAGAR